MNAEDVRDLLRRKVEQAGSQAAWADERGVTPAYVSDVLRGTREPGPAILNALGLERVVSYRQKRPGVVDNPHNSRQSQG
jgi:DNA-binding transcriptional regulator YdaS (Cro superfamily)